MMEDYSRVTLEMRTRYTTYNVMLDTPGLMASAEAFPRVVARELFNWQVRIINRASGYIVAETSVGELIMGTYMQETIEEVFANAQAMVCERAALFRPDVYVAHNPILSEQVAEVTRLGRVIATLQRRIAALKKLVRTLRRNQYEQRTWYGGTCNQCGARYATFVRYAISTHQKDKTQTIAAVLKAIYALPDHGSLHDWIEGPESLIVGEAELIAILERYL